MKTRAVSMPAAMLATICAATLALAGEGNRPGEDVSAIQTQGANGDDLAFIDRVIKSQCIRCHGDEVAEADVSFSRIDWICPSMQRICRRLWSKSFWKTCRRRTNLN